MRKRIVSVLALSALLCAALSLPCPALGGSCSVTVSPGSIAEEAERAGVLIDLYLVAEIDADTSLPVLRLLAPYADASPTEGTLPDEAVWQELTQALTRAALTSGQPLAAGRALNTRIDTADDGTPLSPGLYLLVARGSETGDYTAVVEEDGKERIVTVARTEDGELLFAPELLLLPSPGGEGGLGPWPELSIVEGEPWVYDLAPTLKASFNSWIGSLEIRKTLPVYVGPEEAFFVFNITAIYDGEIIYSDVAAMRLHDAGLQSIFIEPLPVGAEVTVTEVYDGTQYLVTEDTVTVVIQGDGVTVAPFENRDAPTPRRGQGVVNQFVYNGTTWVWRAETEGGGK